VRPHVRAGAPLTRRTRPIFLVALALVILYAGVATWRRANRPGGRWVGQTHCAWIGEPRVTIRPGLARSESIATVAHESVHVAECRALGPVRYRWNTLFAASNLALEIPAYCAAARTRLSHGWSLATVRSTVFDDMRAAMADAVDSTTMHRAIAAGCKDLALSP
jgi:hypothetical protein